MKRYSLWAAVLVLLFVSFSSAQTAHPIKEILYTKKTTLLYPKTYDFTFSFWTDAVSTDPADMVWSEDQTITLNGPKLVTYLGKFTPLNISDFTQQLWVQVEYQKKTGITKVVGTRDRLSIVPYAMQSMSSQTVLSSGAVTSITPTPGSGITSNQTAGDVTLSTDLDVLQTRISNACPSGNAIKGINDNGTVDCEPTGTGTITGVTAGTGLTGGGTSGDVTLDVDLGTGTNQAARGDHNHAGIYQKKYGKIAVVAQSGGDYTDPVAAMADLSTWCGAPSSTNPCLLKIMPGVYDIGTNSLQMQQYVDIEGSGENVTVIKGSCEDQASDISLITKGLLVGSDNAEIRFITITNVGPGNIIVALLNTTSSPIISNVTALAADGSANIGIANLESSSPWMRNISAKATGSALYLNMGILNIDSSPTMTNVTAAASGETYSNSGISNFNSAATMNNLTATGSGAATVNYGVYNGYSSLTTMTNITAVASGGQYNYGVMNQNITFVTMMNIDASAIGSVSNAGVVEEQTTSRLMNVTATASDGSDMNVGMRFEDATTTLQNVTARGKGGTYGYGLAGWGLVGPYTITADSSTFEGSTNSIGASNQFILKIGASKLIGPADTLGTYKCINVYDGTTYTALNTTCQ